MSAGILARIDRAEVLARALVNPPAVPDPVDLFRAAFGEPDPWQVRALRSTAPRLAFNVTRQGGKTGVAATIACHTALAEAGALVLVLSPGLRESQEAFRRVLDVYRAAGRPTPAETENKLALELASGARIVALPGTEKTIRGYAGVRLLIIDEAARVLDDLYHAVRPMLAVSHGRLLSLSTPFGTRGWWYEAWESDETWERYEIPAEQCPRISPEFLAEERRSMGAWWFDQEYGCKFLDAEDAVFRRADIDAAFTDDIAPLFPAPEGNDPWRSIPTLSA